MTKSESKIGFILLVPLVFGLVSNLLSLKVGGHGIEHYILYISTFFSIGIALCFIRVLNNKFTSVVLILICLASMLFGDVSDLSCMPFLLIGFFIWDGKEFFVKMTMLFPALILLVRLSLHDVSLSHAITILCGIIFVFLLYFHYVHPRKFKRYKPNTPEVKAIVNKDVISIVEMRIQGLEWQEINDTLELNITTERVRRKVSDECRRLKFKNKEAFVFWLTKEGLITPFSDD